MKIYSSDSCDAKDCVDLGQAVGHWLGPNSMMMTGTDGKPISRLVRRALTVGLASMGVTVLDMRMVPEVVVSYEVKKQGGGGGLYVSFDGTRFNVILYGSDGQPVSAENLHEIQRLRGQKKPEKLNLYDLGTVLYYPNGIEDYIDVLYQEVSFRKAVAVLADCQTTPMAALVPGLFERYGMKTTLFNGLVSGYGQPRPKEEFLAALRRERFDLGLRFVDVVEIFRGSGAKLEERPGLKEALLFIRDFNAGSGGAGGGR